MVPSPLVRVSRTHIELRHSRSHRLVSSIHTLPRAANAGRPFDCLPQAPSRSRVSALPQQLIHWITTSYLDNSVRRTRCITRSGNSVPEQLVLHASVRVHTSRSGMYLLTVAHSSEVPVLVFLSQATLSPITTSRSLPTSSVVDLDGPWLIPSAVELEAYNSISFEITPRQLLMPTSTRHFFHPTPSFLVTVSAW